MDIRKELENQANEKMAEFSSKLNPTLDKNLILGIKTPVLRTLAKELFNSGDYYDFINDLPHKYLEENQLHGFIISMTKDFNEAVAQLEAFLPYIDNWAVCDQTSPKVFKKNRKVLMPYIKKWLKSKEPYTVRFAVNMLMQHYLDEDFEQKYLDMVASIKTEHYYVQMVMAWYFATALAKQYDSAIKIIESQSLDKWVHNKTIQKSNESFRVTPEHKEYLKSLKLK